MKEASTARLTFGCGRKWMWGAGLVVAVLVGAGCNNADDASDSATAQSPQDNVNKQIQSIQDNPNMPADAKQRTIAAMQARQSPGAQMAQGAPGVPMAPMAPGAPITPGAQSSQSR